MIALAVADAALHRDPRLTAEALVARNESRASSRGRRRARCSVHRALGARAVPHWGWPEAVAADPLAAILSSAGLPIVRPRDTVRIASARRILRSARTRDTRETGSQ